MFRNFLNAKKCPSFNQLMFVNDNIRPKFMMGFSATIYKDISRYVGTRPMSTYFGNRLTISSNYPSGNRFGISYDNKKGKTQNRNVSASLYTNVDGHVSGDLECDVYKNVTFGAWGQRTPKKRSWMNAMLAWSGVRTHARAVLSAGDAPTSDATLSVDNVCRLGNRWSIGSYLELSGVLDGHAAGSGPWSRKWLRPNPIPRAYGAAFRYDGDRDTVSAMVDQDAEVMVQYQRKVTDGITTGTIMTTSVKSRTTKVSWMYRAAFGSGLEIRGQIDTNGLVIGNVCKELLPNRFTMGISASLNHRTNTAGLGVEMNFGMASESE